MIQRIVNCHDVVGTCSHVRAHPTLRTPPPFIWEWSPCLLAVVVALSVARLAAVAPILRSEWSARARSPTRTGGWAQLRGAASVTGTAWHAHTPHVQAASAHEPRVGHKNKNKEAISQIACLVFAKVRFALLLISIGQEWQLFISINEG